MIVWFFGFTAVQLHSCMVVLMYSCMVVLMYECMVVQLHGCTVVQICKWNSTNQKKMKILLFWPKWRLPFRIKFCQTSRWTRPRSSMFPRTKPKFMLFSYLLCWLVVIRTRYRVNHIYWTRKSKIQNTDLAPKPTEFQENKHKKVQFLSLIQLLKG